MPDRRPRAADGYTTPEDYPTRPPFVPQNKEIPNDTAMQIGRLMEAVDGLKASVKEQGEKITSLSQEVHGYKTGFAWVRGLLILLAGLLAWLMKLYLDLHGTPKS